MRRMGGPMGMLSPSTCGERKRCNDSVSGAAGAAPRVPSWTRRGWAVPFDTKERAALAVWPPSLEAEWPSMRATRSCERRTTPAATAVTATTGAQMRPQVFGPT
eukprot:scaffold561_cov254-Pinguiococcus_pyrenoidosus.AAC.9